MYGEILQQLIQHAVIGHHALAELVSWRPEHKDRNVQPQWEKPPRVEQFGVPEFGVPDSLTVCYIRLCERQISFQIVPDHLMISEGRDVREYAFEAWFKYPTQRSSRRTVLELADPECIEQMQTVLLRMGQQMLDREIQQYTDKLATATKLRARLQDAVHRAR